MRLRALIRCDEVHAFCITGTLFVVYDGSSAIHSESFRGRRATTEVVFSEYLSQRRRPAGPFRRNSDRHRSEKKFGKI